MVKSVRCVEGVTSLAVLPNGSLFVPYIITKQDHRAAFIAAQEELLDARGELWQFVVGVDRGRCALELSQDMCGPGVCIVFNSVTNRQ